MKKFTIDKVYDFIFQYNNLNQSVYEPYIDEEANTFFEEAAQSPVLCKDNFTLLRDNTKNILCLISGDAVIGLCSVFEYENESGLICEISLLVAPKYRYHHIGSSLLNHMIISIEKTHSDATILLVGSNQSFAEYNGFTFSHSEHFMHRTNNPDYMLPDNMQLTHKGSNVKTVTYKLCVDNVSVGKCHIYDAGHYLNLSHVYTNKKYRGNGYAGILINAISAIYPDKELLLQVSGTNTSAIRAYTKIGFAFLNTTDYYILED